jgi:FAD synthase
MDLEIVHHIRPEVAFPSIDLLKLEIAKDVEAARQALS